MKISIIIPTRERAEYLKYAVATAIQIPDPEIEIVISNNASTDGTSEFLSSLSDPRIRVVNTGYRASMRQNFEFALLNSSGEYVLYIGDDDGMLAGQFSRLRELLELHRPDTLCYPWVQYLWPVDGMSGRTGTLRIERRKAFGEVSPVKLDFFRTRLLLGKPRISGEMPGIYHGVASRAYLERLKADDQCVFGGRIPDLYISFLSTLAGGTHLYCPQYFSINGASPKSTGASHGKHSKSEDAATPATTFNDEAKLDPIDDVAFFGIGIPQAMFTTLETVRKRKNLTSFAPDYAAWFAAIIRDLKNKSENDRGKSLESLIEYATSTHTEKELNQGMAGRPLSSRFRLFFATGLRERISRSLSNLWSFRVQVPLDQDRTILGACNLMDEILSGEPAKQSQNLTTPSIAWSEIKKRGRKYLSHK